MSLRSDWLGDRLSLSDLLQTGSVIFQVRLSWNSISELSAKLTPVLEVVWKLDLDVLFEVSFSQRFLSLLGSLDGAWLTWRSKWILSFVGFAWKLPYWRAQVHNSQRRLYLVNSPRPTMKSSNPMSGVRVRNLPRKQYHVNLAPNNPTMKSSNI